MNNIRHSNWTEAICRLVTSLLAGAVILGFFMLFLAVTAKAETPMGEDEPAGQVVAEVNGKKILFPLLKTDITADIAGDLASVTVVQTFQNPVDVPIHATYLFPLNKDAAVYAMTMESGDEIVKAKIHRIEEAKAKFTEAKKEGKAASLLIQHRPNMFTQDIANLMPGAQIKVTLKYVHTVSKVDGSYELVMPLVVGPRYQPQGSGQAPLIKDPHDPKGAAPIEAEVNSRTPAGRWEVEKLPAYPQVHGLTIPESIDPDRVSINVNLKSGLPISVIESPTHALEIDKPEDGRAVATLAKGRVIDNRDFVLRYNLDGQEPQAGLLAHKDERGGFFSLLIEPPKEVNEADITPREMVFVLDCSGSMRGLPMDASKRFMKHALMGLRPDDHFRIIRFSDSATEFSTMPLKATPENIARGLDYVRSLSGMGGTEMKSGIIQALDAPKPKGTLRIVTFLTDGYIGNEDEILALIHKKIGPSRLFAFGVGTSVNRFLLSEMGRVGRGFTRYMDPTESPEDVAVELAGKLQSPVLTDIKIDWGDLDVSEVAPEYIPDLFAGGSVRVLGRYEKAGTHDIIVQGLVNGRRAKMAMTVDLPDSSPNESAVAIPLIWARGRIQDHMRNMTNGTDNAAKEKVVNLGLDFSLMTRWTSFVAVTEKIVNPEPGKAKDTHVPLPMVKGVTEHAYGNQPNGAPFAGGSVPEPGTTAGLVVAAGAAWAALRKRRKKDGARPVTV